MISDLSIRDFAIIEQLELALHPGLNVVTGETGAGKSIVIDAMGLLLGGRAEAGMVRAGADGARVEGVFTLEAHVRAQVDPILTREGLEGDTPEVLVLAREVRREGRTVCRINGRTVTLALLKEVGQALVDVHGQSEHLSLLRVKEHLALLDRYAGLDDARRQLAEQARALRALRTELDKLLTAERDRARRVDQLKYQLEEIRAARLKAGEEETLIAERTRLANAEHLAALTDEAYYALAGEADGGTSVADGHDAHKPALDLLGQTVRALANLAKIDPRLAELHATAASAVVQLDDISAELHAYREAIEYNPRRLEQIEDRLELLKRLRRKYGDNLADVLAFGAQAEAELNSLEHSEERITELRAQEDERLRTLGRAALDLSRRRRAAAQELARGIEAELTELRMTGARFGVQFTWAESPRGAHVERLAKDKGKDKEPITHSAGEKGTEYHLSVTGTGLVAAEDEEPADLPKDLRLAYDATGVDRVEFLVAPNPGEGLKPLVKVASGGETSRLMLALKTVLARADQTPTLIFDEIDQGIGGRVGRTVGLKLWRLTDHRGAGFPHQVVCITHLPQLAGYGDAHFHVEKHVRGARTITHIRLLADAERLTELAAMLGAEGTGADQSARDILADVARVKQGG